MRERTLGRSFFVTGKGLHTGLNLTLTLHPAPAGYGIRIRRSDLENKPEFPAIADLVSQTTRGTVLKSGDIQVSTIEHAMAALYAAQIDNCLLEVNGPEFPILDGSSRIYAEGIKNAGITELDKEKQYIWIDEIITYKSDNGTIITASPSEKTELEVTIGFNSSVLKDQKASLTDLSDFNRDFSMARTFVFVRDIEPLLNMNLIKGGDLKNAIVVYDEMMPQEKIDALTVKLNHPRVIAGEPGYLNGPLYYENEPARHKLVDLLGDLSLTGKQIIGRISAYHPGHKINTEFAKLLRDKYC